MVVEDSPSMGPGGEDSGIGPLGMRFPDGGLGDAAPHLRWVGVMGRCALWGISASSTPLQ